MLDHLFVCGYPGDIGGANTELWHTLRLFRRFGLGVTLLPTWRADPTWQARLERIGCRTVHATPDTLDRVPNLAGSIVVSMCNKRFLAAAAEFRRLGCRIVWLGCMNWLFPDERLHYRRHGTFDRYVFQSRYQRDQLVPQLRRFGYEDSHSHVIRGAFDAGLFPLRPIEHRPGERFSIGRISRAQADKFSPQTWTIYRRVPHPIEARVLGWSAEVAAHVGPPPSWAQCRPVGSNTPAAVLAKLHAMVHIGGRATENWPRVGLEAMAAGVPIVADNRGGWREMIRHGTTGYLCDNEDQFAYYTARLAYDEEERSRIIQQARIALDVELANPDTFWSGWRGLLQGLES